MSKLYEELDAMLRKQEFELVKRASHEGHEAGVKYALAELAEFIPEVRESSLWDEYEMEDY